MDKQDIIRNLKLLGEELEALQIQQPVRLLMIGGAYMLTQMGNRPFTDDVDVFTSLDRASEDYRRFRLAIHFIASDAHIDMKWVSDTIGDFLESLGPIPKGTLWLKHGMLEIAIPDPQYILVLKLMAGRDKDLKDIQALFRKFRVKKRAQAESWFHKHVKQYQFDAQMVEDCRERTNGALGIIFKT